jgi:DNA primase
MTAVDEIKARLDIVDIVSETVKLRRSGKSFSGFCPFHPNTKTPAFAVFPDSGTWRCFGECNEGGDIFKYVMKREGWDFAEALRYLAERAGVTLTPLTPERKAEEDEYEALRELLEESVRFYHYQLMKTPAGKPALDYLQKRGINPASIQQFELGYAPDNYEALTTHLNNKGYALKQIHEVGLAVERDSGGFYDKFRNRIMFPIRDGAGKMTGFGGRILDPNDIPKFLNSPQTPLFNKSRLLYGLNLAKKPIREQDQVVIVEGYLDVIALHQQGFANTVSPMGTAMNEDQLRFLKKYTRRMVLALDADAAGEKATLRGLEIARQALDREEEVGFDAHGLLRSEARMQADVRVTTLPEGKDPDDVVLSDPQAWQAILDNARPIVLHVMEALAHGQDLEDAKVKSAIAAQVLPLIEDVPSAVERDTYRQQLARFLKVDESALMGSQKVSQRPRRQLERRNDPRRSDQTVITVNLAQRIRQMETHCLSLLLCHPGFLYDLERALKRTELEKFTINDFEDTRNRSMAELFFKAVNQDQQDEVEYLLEHTGVELDDALKEILDGRPEPGKSDDKLLEDLFRTLVSLRLIHINQTLSQLRFMQEDSSPEDLAALLPLLMQNTQARGRLDRATASSILLS